jgi:hypothetical protein
MPADTDRADRISDAVPDTERGPVWPVTAIVVLLGWCLIAWTVFAGAITTAPFFGETPSRDEYVESGLLALTALVPIAILLALATLAGSRWGLALLAVPALLLVPLGVGMLAHDGDPADPRAGRAVRFGDAFQDLARLNWLAAVVLLAALGLVLWRRRRRAGIPATAQATRDAT